MSREAKFIDPVGSDFNEHLEKELKDPEMAAYFINSAIAENDAKYLKVALGKVVRIHGVTEVSEISKLNRESIYKMLSPKGNPAFANLVEILDVCGLEIAIHPKGQSATAIGHGAYVLKNELSSIIKITVSETLGAYIRQTKKSRPANKFVQKPNPMLARAKTKNSNIKRAMKKG